MFHELDYIPTGIRLHLKGKYYELKGVVDKYDICIPFPYIPHGLKAERLIKKYKLDAIAIPIPDEIFEGCGIAILIKESELEKLISIIFRHRLNFMGIFRKDKEGRFKP